MGVKVCLSADTLGYPEGGGHQSVYLNWALGLREVGCDVIWLEGVSAKASEQTILSNVSKLKQRLEHYGLAKCLALYSRGSQNLQTEKYGCLDFDAATEADLLLNLQYGMPGSLVDRFRRSALLDIDPGRLQIWISEGQIQVAQHDVYLTTGETVGASGSRFPDGGLKWGYTPPCVVLDWWSPNHNLPDKSLNDVPYSTLVHWSDKEDWMVYGNESYINDKRTAFLPFLNLPRLVSQPLEIATYLCALDEEEKEELLRLGWRLRESLEVASTPWDYQRYIQSSRGEFSCARPSCIRLQNAWISDRTICYLASGKPAVVQHTGPSRFLPDQAGLFRFRDMEEAVNSIETIAADYDHQSRSARALAEEFFDARKVVKGVLEQAL